MGGIRQVDIDSFDYDVSTDGWTTAWGVAALVVGIALYVVTLIAYIRILQKAGYSGWWVLIGLVPVVNFVMFLVFAFVRWPVTRENEALRRQVGIPPDAPRVG